MTRLSSPFARLSFAILLTLSACSTFQDPESISLREDQDGDGLPDSEDNCPQRVNPTQQDLDANQTGDLCEGPLSIQDQCLRPPIDSLRFNNSCAASIDCEAALQGGEANDYRVILDEVELVDSALRGNFACAYLRGARGAGALSLEGVFCRADLTEANFPSLSLVGEQEGYRQLIAPGATLPDLCARDQDLSGANFQSADLSGAQLGKAKLEGAKLQSASLQAASLLYADLRDSDLSNADLRGVRIDCADLRGADLSGSDLSGVDLRFVWLEGTRFTGAILDDAMLPPGFPTGSQLYVREPIDGRGAMREDGAPACSAGESDELRPCTRSEQCQ